MPIEACPFFTNAKAAARSSSPCLAIAESFVRMARCRVLASSKKVAAATAMAEAHAKVI
jgi:hypothetical protein